MRCSFPEILRLIRKMNRLTDPQETTALGQVTLGSHGNPFGVLITTILSQRTRDDNTKRASEQLFQYYPDVWSLASANLRHVEKLIRPSGFYHVKAASIISVAKTLANEYKGIVPKNLDDLLKLPSVGRKTANCVLTYGFRIPAIPVDTHVHRIANRLTIVRTNYPEETEFELRKRVARRFWLGLNEEFVKFGQRVCRPVRPRCLVCLLDYCCDWYKSYRKAEETLWSDDRAYGRLRAHIKCNG